MAKSVYATLATVVGSVMASVGVGALAGGVFARHFVGKQLASEDITMPDSALIDKELTIGLIDDEDARKLRPHAGVTLSDGPQARIYSDNYILSHMHFAARQAGVPGDKATYAGVGDVIDDTTLELRRQIAEEPENAGKTGPEIKAMAKMEIRDPETIYESARKIASLQKLRADNFFMGNALRGMLLNAYAWWLVGFVATVAGWALVGIGSVMTILGLRKS